MKTEIKKINYEGTEILGVYFNGNLVNEFSGKTAETKAKALLNKLNKKYAA